MRRCFYNRFIESKLEVTRVFPFIFSLFGNQIHIAATTKPMAFFAIFYVLVFLLYPYNINDNFGPAKVTLSLAHS
jgi:hypothetical protein